MKLKSVYTLIALIFLIVGVALWKLNDTYRAEKMAQQQNQLQSQLTSLRASIVSQLSQLRNTLSTYTLQIDESKINWIQLKPFYALATVQENPQTNGQHQLVISKLFLQSGTVAERWNVNSLQKNISKPVSGQSLTRIQTFKDADGIHHLVITMFDREKKKNTSRSGIMVVGDVSYFQRFFDLQRTSSARQVLLTSDKFVTAHSQYEYVGNRSNEEQMSHQRFLIDRLEIRGTNLSLLGYSSKSAGGIFNVPLPILGIILGLGFLMSGILLYAAKPVQAGSSGNSLAHHDVSNPIQGSMPQAKPISAINTKLINPSPVVENKPVALKSALQVQEFKVRELIFDEQVNIVPIQIQACAQQALFNIDRHLKNKAILVNKEFASQESVMLDYSRFIKIFENIMLSLTDVESSAPQRKMYIRSYDDQQLTTLEIQLTGQTSKVNYQLPDMAFAELKKANGEYELALSSAGETIFKFIFKRPVVERKEIADLLPPVSAPVIQSNELDIEALLSLDDDSDHEKSDVLIKSEMQTTQFKLDQKIQIVEDPVIQFKPEISKVDQQKVKIRRPEKG